METILKIHPHNILGEKKTHPEHAYGCMKEKNYKQLTLHYPRKQEG